MRRSRFYDRSRHLCWASTIAIPTAQYLPESFLRLIVVCLLNHLNNNIGTKEGILPQQSWISTSLFLMTLLPMSWRTLLLKVHHTCVCVTFHSSLLLTSLRFCVLHSLDLRFLSSRIAGWSGKLFYGRNGQLRQTSWRYVRRTWNVLQNFLTALAITTLQ